jgi:pilin isopeptide linkage protein
MTYNVFDQASLDTALGSSDSTIDIIVTGSFTMTSAVTIPSSKTVTITSGAGGPYTITRGTSATGNLITVSSGSSLTLEQVTLDGNKGAIVTDGPLIFNSGTLTLNNGSVVQNNSSTAGKGGGVYSANSTSLILNGGVISNNTVSNGQGGGVYNDYNATFTMLNGEISGNEAAMSGGFTGYGGGVHNEGYFTMEDGKISSNKSSADVQYAGGGGVQNYGSFTMNGGVIGGDSAAEGNVSYRYGGGVFSQGTFTMNNGRISYNSTEYSGNGGGVFINQNRVFTMYNGSIDHNTSESGGGIYSGWSGVIRIYGGSVTYNTATRDAGGAGYHLHAEFTMSNATLSNNSAGATGGGIYGGMTATITNSVISNNSAGDRGGFAYITRTNYDAYLRITDSTVTGNSARIGGSVYSTGAPVILTRSVMSNNRSVTDGGAIYIRNYDNYSYRYPDARVDLIDSTMSNNTAGGNGGAIYAMYDASLDPVAVSVDGVSVLSANTAGGNGGGIWVAYENLATLDVGPSVIFSGNRASAAYNRNPIDEPTYFAHIEGTNWTSPFPQGYNNYDIAYTNGDPWDWNFDVSLDELFNPPVKQILVHNLGDVDAYVRIRLREFMEIGGVPVVSGTSWNTSTWIPHFARNYAAQDALFHQYYQWTLGPNVISMTDWIAAGSPAGTYWVYDPADGWVSWAEPLIPGESTGLLLDEVNLIKTPSSDWSYAILAEMEAHSPDGSLVDNSQNKENLFSGVPPISADVNLTAVKTAVGAPLPAGRFDFGVFDENGNLIAAASADASGIVTFPAIPFYQTGIYNYTIRELSRSGGGWIVDSRKYPVTVTVTDDGSGQLTASVSYLQGRPAFVNTYTASTAQVNLQLKKALCGACLCPGLFTFGLFDQSGSEVSRATNDACGNIIFPTVTFSQTGIHTYTIRELNPFGNGCGMDSCVYSVTITVTNNGSGRLAASVSCLQRMSGFVNRYCTLKCCCTPKHHQ